MSSNTINPFPLVQANADVQFQGDYTYHNPDSINGPFGNFSLVMSDDNIASGRMIIETLFGLGSITHLVYQGKWTGDGSTGFITVEAEAHGTISVRPNPPRPIKTTLNIVLKPGFETGTVSVRGFFQDFPCVVVRIRHQ